MDSRLRGNGGGGIGHYGVKYLLAIMLVFGLFVCSAQAAAVCRCGEAKSVEEYQERAFGVFVGTVVDQQRYGLSGRVRTEFAVHAVWKGAKSESLSVIAEDSLLLEMLDSEHVCGFHFEPNQTYLVFSYRKKKNQGPAWTSRCWPTLALDDVDAFSRIFSLGAPNYTHNPPEKLRGFLADILAPESEESKKKARVFEMTPLLEKEVQPYLLPSGISGRPVVQMPYIDR